MLAFLAACVLLPTWALRALSRYGNPPVADLTRSDRVVRLGGYQRPPWPTAEERPDLYAYFAGPAVGFGNRIGDGR